MSKHPNQSKKLKLLWSDKEWKEKTINSRKKSYTSDRSKRQSETLKNTYEEHPEIKQQISETLKKTYEEHPEILVKMANSQKERYKNNPELITNMSKNKREKYNTPEFVQNMSKIKKAQHDANPEKYKENCSKAGKKAASLLTPEERKKKSTKMLKALSQTKTTLIEKLIAEELTRRNIYFLQQVPVLDKYLVDFIILDNIIIEADGLYWHHLPWVQERDKIRDEVLRSHGFIIFRFWEDEIKRDVSGCIDKINEIINISNYL